VFEVFYLNLQNFIDIFWAYITWIELVVFSLNVIMIFVCFFYRFYKNKRDKFKEHLEEFYIEKIYSEWMTSEEDFSFKNVFLKKDHRPILKMALVNTISAISGEQKEHLISIYENFGFLHEDLENLQSKEWGDRLYALSILDFVARKDVINQLVAATKDEIIFIKYLAIKLASRFSDHPDSFLINIKELEESVRKHPDIVTDALLSICQRNPKYIINILFESLDENLLLKCMEVLSENSSEDGLDLIITSMMFNQGKQKFLSSGFNFLVHVGSLEGVDLAKKNLNSPNPYSRYSALNYLYSFLIPLEKRTLERLSYDQERNVAELALLIISEQEGIHV